MDIVYRLAKQFRDAMDRANEAGEFDNVLCFDHFPRGSCGDTCYLLAEFLLKHGIYTEYVWGEAYSWSHAWLVVADTRDLDRKRREREISFYRREFNENSNSYEAMLNAIQNNATDDFESPLPNYASELKGRAIIDLTGDQFYDKPEFLCYDVPVYVGAMDEFHCLFDIRDVHECTGLAGVGAFNQHRLSALYHKIEEYLDK